MDSGTAAVLGALIGVASTPLSTWFSDYWRHHRSDRTDSLRRRRLQKILNQPTRKWRKIEYLSDAIGATEEKAARLLLEIDARRSFTKGSTSWALVSRAPFPDDAMADAQADDEGNTH
jgi:hypothetical protein